MFEKTKINEKEAGVGPFKKNPISIHKSFLREASGFLKRINHPVGMERLGTNQRPFESHVTYVSFS